MNFRNLGILASFVIPRVASPFVASRGFTRAVQTTSQRRIAVLKLAIWIGVDRWYRFDVFERGRTAKDLCPDCIGGLPAEQRDTIWVEILSRPRRLELLPNLCRQRPLACRGTPRRQMLGSDRRPMFDRADHGRFLESIGIGNRSKALLAAQSIN